MPESIPTKFGMNNLLSFKKEKERTLFILIQVLQVGYKIYTTVIQKNYCVLLIITIAMQIRIAILPNLHISL